LLIGREMFYLSSLIYILLIGREMLYLPSLIYILLIGREMLYLIVNLSLVLHVECSNSEEKNSIT
jgi:hypothetical protein